MTVRVKTLVRTPEFRKPNPYQIGSIVAVVEEVGS
jgi:hypothetical protein